MKIRTNVSALTSHRNLNKNNRAFQKDLEKLASGYAINRAGDDASGLAITEKMKAQITALGVASKNSEDGISLIQTADGNLEEVQNMLQRMHELGMKSANGILEDKTDREGLQEEFEELQEEIDRISDTVNFNQNNLFGGRDAVEGADSITMPAGTPKQVGNFLITGGTEGVDYRIENGRLKILTDKLMKISGGLGQEIENDVGLRKVNLIFDGINTSSLRLRLVKDMKITFADGSNNSIGRCYIEEGIGEEGVLFQGNGTLSVERIAFLQIGKLIIKDMENINIDVLECSGEIYFENVTANINRIRLDRSRDIINISADSRVTSDNVYNQGGTINGTIYNSQNPAPPKDTSAYNDIGTKRVFAMQIGETSNKADKLNVNVGIMNTKVLGVARNMTNITTIENANKAVDIVKEAINRVSLQRANLGAYQNRLDYTINNLDTAKENTESAKSRIKDTDMAKEMMEYTKNNVLMQSAQAMLAQANTQPNNVLSLLQ